MKLPKGKADNPFRRDFLKSLAGVTAGALVIPR